jgi:hypothetical protein
VNLDQGLESHQTRAMGFQLECLLQWLFKLFIKTILAGFYDEEDKCEVYRYVPSIQYEYSFEVYCTYLYVPVRTSAKTLALGNWGKGAQLIPVRFWFGSCGRVDS